MDREAGVFRVLLAEDDAVSRAFLRETCEACGATVTDCADGLRALALATSEPWDLLVLDQHLPGMDGDRVLASLRKDRAAAANTTPAIATSAACEVEAEPLLRAGFIEVLEKPMEAGILCAALRRRGCPQSVPLDDDDALRACGSPGTVTRLRRLFADEELPMVQAELERLDDDLTPLLPTLHRLRASCGFCGARSLAEATAALHHAIASNAKFPGPEAEREVFRAAIADARVALHARMDTGGPEPVD